MIWVEIYIEKPYGHEFEEVILVLSQLFSSASTGNAKNATKLFVFIKTNY
jgi:hypothetical protein